MFSCEWITWLPSAVPNLIVSGSLAISVVDTGSATLLFCCTKLIFLLTIT